MKKYNFVLLVIILLVTLFFRFNGLGDISTGLHADEASQAFNAYSLLHTGKDMFGKTLPILFRANGSYQPPVYTYLTIIPVYLFGNTVFSARFISALAGSLLVLITFIFIYRFGVGNNKERISQAFFSSVILSISPWAIHFSRLAVEGNLVIPFYTAGLVLLATSIKKKWYFPIACFLFGITTHVYYSERITSIVLTISYILLFKKYFKGRLKEVVLGFCVFALVLIPHLMIARTGALTNRLTQVGYLGNAGAREGNIFNRFHFISGQFADHYLSYYSPKNLFFDPGQDLGRTTPDLSMFFPWFFVFALVGIKFLIKNRQKPLVKLLGLVLITSPLPAGITGDLFYPLRVLTFLWAVGIVVGYGFYATWNWFKYKRLRYIFLSGILLYSSFYFYVSYFATSKYSTSPDLGYSYIKLMQVLPKYQDKKILVDFSGRSWGVGVRMIYLMKANLKEVQKNLSSQLVNSYYSGVINPFLTYEIGNIVVKPVNWYEICENTIIVGDRYSISEHQIKDHGLKLEFAIPDITNTDVLFGYSSLQKCKD